MKNIFRNIINQKAHYLFLFALLIAAGSPLKAQNPITLPGIYMADPSAHQWADGKMYVYGSRDESPGYFCSQSYDVLYSTDLTHWKVASHDFGVSGNVRLWAPDCMYRNNQYYLYYCLSDQTEGVAVSTSPVGPFLNGKALDLGKNKQIDPCVFFDDDGQAYYIWGQFHAKVARLKPDMETIDSSTIRDNVVNQKEHYFHEGAFMIKRKGIYYMIYTDMQRAGRPTCIGYAMGKSPFGPFKYGGVIIDNNHCDPGVWNNHGCLAEFNHQWYVFYHRSTNDCYSMRKTCIEPFRFNKDGTIPEVEMTSQGAGTPFDATQTITAERACLLYGNVRIQAFADGNEALASIRNDDKAAYKYVNFGGEADSVTIRVAPGKYTVMIDFALDDSWGPSIGSVKIPGNRDGKTWITFGAKVKAPVGVHALWLRFYGNGEDLFKVKEFKFRVSAKPG